MTGTLWDKTCCAYETHYDVEPVACADIVPDNTAAFASTDDLDEDYVFESFEVMIESADTDGEGLHSDGFIRRAIDSVVEAVDTGDLNPKPDE